jgi:hypothetical protein
LRQSIAQIVALASRGLSRRAFRSDAGWRQSEFEAAAGSEVMIDLSREVRK